MPNTNVRVSFEIPYELWPKVETAIIKLLPRGTTNIVVRDGVPYVPQKMEPLSIESLRKLEATVVQFVDEYHMSCSEAAYQMDDVNEAAPELLIAVADLVGYYNEPDTGEAQ